MLVALVVACEIAFWVVLLMGLTIRYVLHRPVAGGVVLAMVPLVDLVLLVAAWLDLRRGGMAQPMHGLAAVYLGVSIAYGRDMIRWADERMAYRFGGGPPPAPRPRTGPAHARRERRLWMKHLLAWTVGVGLLGLGTLLVGHPDRTRALWAVAGLWTVVLAIDFVISMSYTIWPRRR